MTSQIAPVDTTDKDESGKASVSAPDGAPMKNKSESKAKKHIARLSGFARALKKAQSIADSLKSDASAEEQEAIEFLTNFAANEVCEPWHSAGILHEVQPNKYMENKVLCPPTNCPIELPDHSSSYLLYRGGPTEAPLRRCFQWVTQRS